MRLSTAAKVDKTKDRVLVPQDRETIFSQCSRAGWAPLDFSAAPPKAEEDLQDAQVHSRR